MFEVEVCGCGAHLFFYLGDEFGEFFAGHGLWVFLESDFGFGYCFGYGNEVADCFLIVVGVIPCSLL